MSRYEGLETGFSNLVVPHVNIENDEIVVPSCDGYIGVRVGRPPLGDFLRVAGCILEADGCGAEIPCRYGELIDHRVDV